VGGCQEGLAGGGCEEGTAKINLRRDNG
jgi:hypothetical protein